MTELHAGLDLYREQLRHAIAQQLDDQTQARNRARRALRVALPIGAAVAAGAAALTFTGEARCRAPTRRSCIGSLRR